MKTYSQKPAEVLRNWYLIDASEQTLGRLASKLAYRMRGKDKPTFTPHVDMSDFFIIVNASQVAVTGRKESQKMYYTHTGTAGGLKERNLAKQRAHNPETIIKNAVKGMLPKGPLGREVIKKLKIYGGSEHPHAAQNPQKIEL